MGAGASAGYELSSADKIQIAKAIEETYDKGKGKTDIELFEELKSAYEAKSKALQPVAATFTDISPANPSPPTKKGKSVQISSEADGVMAPKMSPGPLSSKSGKISKAASFAGLGVTNIQDEADEEGYEFSLRNSFSINSFAKKGHDPHNSSAPTIVSKIEGPGKLLKAKTSTQLISMVEEDELQEHSKIAEFINKLKAGEVQTKAKTEFRQRRLTYSQRTDEDNGVPSGPESTKKADEPSVLSPPKPTGRAPRTTIFASSEIGVKQEKLPPFPNEVLGTYSCHGIEPAPPSDVYNTTGIHEKINQDRGCVVYPYNNRRNQALFMVLDGHGEQGDKVSEFVMRQIVVSLEKDPLLNTDPPAALKNAFITTNTALLVTDIHYMTSGCTCVCVYVKENKMYVANAGDSRAVMARRKKPGVSSGEETEDSVYSAFALSRDHKPDDPDEEARITSWGGFVCPPHEEGLSARVYLDEAYTMIGLAMSRSIGDHAVKNVGVWEFITSQEAVDIVASCLQGEHTTEDNEHTHSHDGDMHSATQELIEVAAGRWQENEGDYRDDITAIVVKFPLPNFIDASAT
eukprot:gene26294-31763_t